MPTQKLKGQIVAYKLIDCIVYGIVKNIQQDNYLSVYFESINDGKRQKALTRPYTQIVNADELTIVENYVY
jgi:hypothetical protein